MVKIVREIFRSSLMGGNIRFRISLPENYGAPAAKCPVLYMLHGLFGNSDNWFELTGIEKYLSDKKFAVVFPDGGDKWYSDSATIENDKYESFFLNEFIPAIESRWNIDGSRETRAIAGLSMGGYGAFKFALKHRRLFVFAASMSGAFDAPRLTANTISAGQRELLASIAEVFGREDDHARAGNDLFEIVRKIPAAEIRELPYFYFACGRRDEFLKANRELAGLFEAKKIRFNFVEAEGAHDWCYWDRQIQSILELTAKAFEAKRKLETDI